MSTFFTPGTEVRNTQQASLYGRNPERYYGIVLREAKRPNWFYVKYIDSETGKVMQGACQTYAGHMVTTVEWGAERSKISLVRLYRADINFPEGYLHDDNLDSMYAVMRGDVERIGYVYKVTTERAWHALDADGTKGPTDENWEGPIRDIFTSTRTHAVRLLVEAAA